MRVDLCPVCGVHALTHDIDPATGLLIHGPIDSDEQ